MNFAITSKIPINNFKSSNTRLAQNKNNKQDKNPISRTGETANLAKATFVAGIGLGSKLLFELLDDDFLFEHAGKAASKLVDKNKQIVNPTKKALCKAGGTIGLLAAGVGIFAIAYTLYKAPNIAYQSKVNTFTKKNDMDVFIASNKAQKNIYEKMNTKAQSADTEEKEKLKEQYAKMQLAQG